MLSCTSSNTLTRGKYQRVPQNLGNPTNGWTLEWGWVLGHLPCPYHCITMDRVCNNINATVTFLMREVHLCKVGNYQGGKVITSEGEITLL